MRCVRTVGRVRHRCLVLGLLFVVAACSEDELILPGEREAVRPVDASLVPLASQEGAAVPALAIPAPRANTDWTHVSGSTEHLGTSLALAEAPARRWSVSIGRGNQKRARISSGPIVAGGVIYTLDAGATVSAVSTTGRVLWQSDLVPEDEGDSDTFGGGLAFGDGALVVTTGYAEVLRLDPATGDVIWRVEAEGPFRSSPTVADGRVIAVARGDIAYGIDLATGETDWRVQGTGLGAGLVGGSAPALRGPLAILPFTSGEITAVLARNGLTVWNAAVTGGRREQVLGGFDHISGDPVIDNDIVYAANQGGRLVSFDRRSGERLWTHRNGSYNPALPVGGSLFVMSDTAELLRLNAETGAVIWSRQLPEWQRPDRRQTAIPHFGPLLAGGRLLVASGDEAIRFFDPATGADRGEISIPGGAAAQPAVAGGVLYVVSATGQLHAFQ